jgi:hypothetical protein
MPVLIAAAAAADSGFDWTKIVGIPASIAAVIGLVCLFVGIIHPAAVQKPIYWHDGSTTRMRLTVKNRSFGFDRHINKIVLYKMPGVFKRISNRKWGSQSSSLPIVPWGLDLPTANQPFTLTKRAARPFECELRTAAGDSAKLELDKTFRVEVKSGWRRSRRKKIRFQNV